ncbi:uncharacterized protein LOC127848822 [Dreissena polymorpha]|nr:uncharacterized protein LOC127848822 [Dreissena polymorpha]
MNAFNVWLLLSFTGFDMVIGLEQVTAQSDCNPNTGIVFVLDTSSALDAKAIQLQEEFVELVLRNHRAPRGAVRVSVARCGNNVTIVTPFVDPYYSTDAGEAGFSIERDLTNSSVQDAALHCLENVKRHLTRNARDGTTEMVVLLKGTWDWPVEGSYLQATALRDRHVVLVVIAIGVWEFDGLSALRLLATGDPTYFVLSKFENLRLLATILTKGSCTPITLDLTLEGTQHIASTTTQAVTQEVPCILLSPTAMNRYVAGFGYIQIKCGRSDLIDLQTCNCTG